MASPALSSKPTWMSSSDELLSLDQINAEHSAQGCALMRFIESHKPVGERLFHDPYAEIFLAQRYRQWQETDTAEWLVWLGALRERYIDDLVRRAILEGARQLVLFGAGYDARGLRMRELKEREILVFEIDQPFMIEEKKSKLWRHIKYLPSHLRFVGLDFNKDGFELLLHCGYKPEKKSIFVAQALSYYLETYAMEKMFAFVRSSSVGSSLLIFDYVNPVTMATVGGSSVWDGLNGTHHFALDFQRAKKYLSGVGFHYIINESLRNIENRYTGKITLPVNGWYIACCSCLES